MSNPENNMNSSNDNQEIEKHVKSNKPSKNRLNPTILQSIKRAQEEKMNAEKLAEEEAQREKEGQEEYQRKRDEELKLEQLRRNQIKEKRKARIDRQREEGTYLTARQKQKQKQALAQFQAVGINIPTNMNSHSNVNETDKMEMKPIVCADQQNQFSKRCEAEVNCIGNHLLEKHFQQDEYVHDENVSSLQFRAPIICVLGHVNAGKTTLLDNLRQTNVQNNEAGGITQQIGATNVPLKTLRERVQMCCETIGQEKDIVLPGLVILDTPGHETFKNLRLRGASICDLSVLIVDMLDGLEQQTIESIKILVEKQIPFIVALNKIDLLCDWKADPSKDIECLLQQQSSFTKNHFEKRCNEIVTQFAEQGLNVALYYQNPDQSDYYSMVPVSARTSDGMSTLIATIIEQCQNRLSDRLLSTNEIQANVMEVRTINGLSTTIDVILINGQLSIGDKIIVAGQEGPIVSHIRGLLIPESNEEIRIATQYKRCKQVFGTCGVKILAKDLENCLPGLPLFVAKNNHDDIDSCKMKIETLLNNLLKSIELKEEGVYVQASTLGALESLLELLNVSNIPVSGVNIGPVHRKDVMRASTQLGKHKLWSTILAFDVKIEKDVQDYANKMVVKIIQRDEVYQLERDFNVYRNDMIKENRNKYEHLAVFPCKLKILPQYVFNKRCPLICGVFVEDGFIKIGTPICIPSKDYIDIGRIVSIERNHQPLNIARKGLEVCIKVESVIDEGQKMYGRHFNHDDILMSKISRQSIDVVKEYFYDEMSKSDWALMIELKQIFGFV